MAKINLLTIHYSTSCGAIMQTYATCRMLEELGHEVAIINLQKKKGRTLKVLFSFLKYFNFERFRRKYLPVRTPRMYIPDLSMIPEADYFLVGSDQVWNPLLMGDSLIYNFLSFVPDGIPRISYASSFGLSDIRPFLTINLLHSLKRELTKFKSVSVREDSGVNICKHLLGKEATQVLDPTLLLPDYSDLTGNPKEQDEIACFFIGLKNNKEAIVSIIRLLKKELNSPVTYLEATSLIKGVDKYYFAPFMSPVKWLKVMKRAKFILTSSFHGVAFALVFRKQFLVFNSNEQRIGRISSLLRILHLEDRMVANATDLKQRKAIIHEAIDYDSVYSILNEKQIESIDYLKKSLCERNLCR